VVARFLTERSGKRARIETRLEIRQPPVLPLGFAVDGVLQSLHELLEVGDALLQVLERRRSRAAGRRRAWGALGECS
jgi:hypothetical protein